MAAFRRCILALALFASFAILASAQNIVPMACTTTAFNNAMRAEGKNELIGDLVISCTGGNPLANGTAAPRVDFTVTLPQAVTSRLASTPTTTAVASDALLLIDDPNPAASPIAGAIAGFGSNAPPLACASTNTTATTIQGDCPTFVETDAGNGIVYAANTAAVNPPAVNTSADNIYVGQVFGNTVKFVGVPVVVPGNTSGVARTFRITNVRMNATAATAGPQAISVAITSTSGQTGNIAGLFGSAASIATNLGTVATGLSSTKWTAASPGLTTCAAITAQYAGTVSFTEGFGSAFKVRETPGAAANSAQSDTAQPNTVPQAYQTESGYTPTATGLAGGGDIAALDVAGKKAGVADFGTRLKAVFTNIPSGARVFVSFSNVEKATSTNIGIQNSNMIAAGVPSAAVGSTATTSFAALITGTEGASLTLATPSVSAVGSIYANFGYNELTVSSTGSATAVWEVLNTNSTANETFTFSVFVTQAAQGTTGTGTVNLSFAPTASTSTTIPSFNDTSGSGTSAIAITSCRTILLFPYVTSAAGFDTGVAVANTTSDNPLFGTTAQAGICQMYVYGVTAATDTAPTNNGPFSPFDAGGKAFPATGVPSGQVAEWLVSQASPGFTGYAIVSCNFQYAHGFAFVYSPVLSAAMGYLPLVLPSPVTRGSSPETSTF